MFKLNQDQQEAIANILTWLDTSDPYYILSGAAGTGKTFTIQALSDQFNEGIVYTAPTNKATKVLRSTLTTENFRPSCRTIHSLLGLKMVANGAIKELASPEDPVDLRLIQLVIIDEASMVNTQLMEEIEKAADNYNLKILFLGDANQLPPVNERISPVWKITKNISTLKKVMRFEDKILAVAEDIESKVNHPCPSITFENNYANSEGVWCMHSSTFYSSIVKAAKLGTFSNPLKLTKAIAWRNKTVRSLNILIRKSIFDNADQDIWLPEDRIILTNPASDMEGNGIAHTDDEGKVERVAISPHPIYTDIMCYNLSVITDENKRISLWTLHEDGVMVFQKYQSQFAEEAKFNGTLWGDYWEFMERFHVIQHGYAITAHRAQGSTYEACFVVWNDILLNRNRNEAFRCLYVACTRPKRKLILGRF